MNQILIILIVLNILKLNNNNLVECALNGTAGNNGNRDRRQQCALPTLENGMTRVRQRGKLARFQCYKGFKLIGNTYAGCLNGKWDTSVPVCAKAGCPNISTPKNGFIVMDHGNATALLFCREGYQIAGARQTFCGGSKWDRDLGSCRETQNTPQRFCDFEVEDLCGWSHDDTDDFEWRRVLGHEDSRRRTGPQHDHTTMKSNSGHYMLVESYNHLPDDRARLISPLFPAKLSRDTCFKFFYHMYGATVGSLRVYIKPMSLDMDSVTQDPKYLFFEKNANQGNKWHEGFLNIEQLDEDFQIVIEGSAGTNHLSDIAIDDVSLLDEEDCMSDVRETTVADQEESGGIFDIQSCKNRCEETVSMSKSEFIRILNGTGKGGYIKICDCHKNCEDSMTCCPDYRDICAFEISYGLDDIAETQERVTFEMSTTAETKLLPDVTTNTNKTTTTTTTTTTPATTTKTTPTLKSTARVILSSVTKSRTTTTNNTTPSSTTKLKTTATITAKPNMTSTQRTRIFPVLKFLTTSTLRHYTTSTTRPPTSSTKKQQITMTSKNTMRTPSTRSTTTRATTTTKKRIFLIYTNARTFDSRWKATFPRTTPKPFYSSRQKQDKLDREVKDHERELNVATGKRKNGWNTPGWVIVVFSLLLVAGLISASLFLFKYYRIYYGPENYKNRVDKCSKRHLSYSDVVFLTSEEHLDFNLQGSDDL